MGFFSKLGKAMNPVSHIKDPKKGLKTSAMMAVDPAGTTIRAGRGNSRLTGRTMVDPGGFFDGRPQAQQTPYQAQAPLRLSAGAQQLYDNMKARTAQRMSQQQPAVAPVQDVGQLVRGRMMADGGKVDSGEECHPTKVVNRKPNGKPY